VAEAAIENEVGGKSSSRVVLKITDDQQEESDRDRLKTRPPIKGL
jgi:hypothetical protein